MKIYSTMASRSPYHHHHPPAAVRNKSTNCSEEDLQINNEDTSVKTGDGIRVECGTFGDIMVRNTDMPNGMCKETVELFAEAFILHSPCNESVSRVVKEALDKRFGSSWHVVIGEDFGLEISHEMSHMLYAFFKQGTLGACAWKCP
ncbi:dynein axonemal light chain 4-like [Convolutriloba macropyga]|uniref:dynein axonemal light chain 4-like n=1 Tax=Convolutriloba macropyga TaxID=536237 RepID=UPI003F51E310